MIRKGMTIAAAFTILMTGAVAMAGTSVDITEYKMKDIDGREVDLGERYKGKVVMIVNVASKCGLTPQYEQLQEVYEKYGKEGFAIAGFPANDFMKQEPGSELEIKQFCTTKYGVEFDMYSKITVKGEGIHPLYKALTEKETNGEHAGEIQWNFDKFLVGRDGKVAARFGPRTKPDDEKILEKIKSELEKPAPAGAAKDSKSDK